MSESSGLNLEEIREILP
ncbi:MAG: hypothetical protein COZ56_11170, partial [Armatimonadetes bacterium CG_4_8_14_3_um_filter_58_9]